MQPVASQAPMQSALEHPLEAAEVGNEQEPSKEKQPAMAIAAQQVQQVSTEQAQTINHAQSTE